MLIGANLVANEATPSIVDIATRAEDRGMDCIFQGEHSHVPVATEYPGAANGVEMPEFYRRFPDVFVLLAAAAAVTTRLRLGTGVALVAEHNSFHLAKATATPGRLSWRSPIAVSVRTRLPVCSAALNRRFVSGPVVPAASATS